ncbi:hypothetical protein OUZ56_025351 [Daphnia magna]|uniref:Uncharacterized protein n=1 Tax=Daphnia magna TaxID=35525 RepID=A0ABQ9ZJK6_9CRUS|nr:hypothetical protein OUZ56_025351 [Daphnia magna]
MARSPPIRIEESLGSPAISMISAWILFRSAICMFLKLGLSSVSFTITGGSLDSLPHGFLRGGLRDCSRFSGPIDKLVLGAILASVGDGVEAGIWARMINQLFHEDNCHIVAFIAQENQVKWSPDLILPENVPVPILKTTKEGKKNLGPILEFIETPEVEAAKKLWINIYNEKQAIREKPPEWIQAKYDRLETIRSKREEIKKKQLEAANSTVTNLSPVFFSVQESETLPSNIISPDNK